MAVTEVVRDLTNLFNYSTDENPTAQQDYQEAVKNWVNTIINLVDCTLWQPDTEYSVGNVLRTPSLPYHLQLICITAGTTGSAEPDYTDIEAGDTVTDGTVVWSVQSVFDAPTGVVHAFAGSTTPAGWLLCDGSAVSRTDYAALYAVIGTTYGTGDGSTTFNLPNLIDKFVEGSATSGTVKSAGLPNIEGTADFREQAGNASVIIANSGAFGRTNVTRAGYAPNAAGSTTTRASQLSINASNSNSIYGNSTTVQPPALTMRYIIKY